MKHTAFRPVAIFFSGLGISLGYGVLATVLVWTVEGEDAGLGFFYAYTTSFKTIISFGLIIGAARLVGEYQKEIPRTIKAAFRGQRLPQGYRREERYFWSRRKTTLFAAQLAATAFVIFWYCRFPLSPLGDILMLIAVCAQYALASFVGRKLRYTAAMLHELRNIDVPRNLFKGRRLDRIHWCVNIASTLTVIFVYVHVTSYYNGPFLYDSTFGASTRIFLLFPAIIATPVLLIFNFYPREVLRILYRKSIENELVKLRITLSNENLSPYEKRSHELEYEKMSQDELRYNLHLALTDLPIGITILVMFLQPLLK